MCWYSSIILPSYLQLDPKQVCTYVHPHTVQLLTEGDDTRGCGDTIGPPDDEQRLMMSSVLLETC